MIQAALLAVGLCAASPGPLEPLPPLGPVGASQVEAEDDDRAERRVRRQRRGGDAFREDVVTLKDGSVLRGSLTSQEDDAWFIRIAGGSVLRIDPDEVDTVFRESRYAHPTAHGGQVLLRGGLGFEGDIAYAENFATHSGLMRYEWLNVSAHP